jgi:ATP-dependent Clp protease ATP-binding subunit ClpB
LAAEGGYLTEAVRRRPYSVILLDEIEKAHNDVFNILLQVLDDGRLTDGQGRTVDFRNTVIIMTSNLETVTQHFRPEFINRIDEIVVFHSLEQTQIRAITNIQIKRLQKRLAERELTLNISDDALDFLSKTCYDPVYGARPLKRAIQRDLENPLAPDILSGKFVSGDTIGVKLKDNKLIFSKK